MRRLLHHLVAFGVILSVMLSTLGVAHPSCDQMGRAGEATAAAGHMPGMPMGDAPAPDGGCGDRSPTPAEHGGSSSCLLVAHCGTVMVAGYVDVRLAVASVTRRTPVADDAGPLDLALEPESPPPRS